MRIKTVLAAAVMLAAAGTANAADEPAKLGISWNVGATTDYIFRGISQNARGPTPQGGVDITYGIFYGGLWASGVDFGQNPYVRGSTVFTGLNVASTEVDVYGGIKPVWGPVTFDIGAIYYAYPNSNDGKVGQYPRQAYLEGKLGATFSPITNLTTGVTLFASPEYTGKQGKTQVVEGTVAYELPKIPVLGVPTLGGTYGMVFGDSKNATHTFYTANFKDSYAYWNAGITFAIDKLSLDFRYWDTNIADKGSFPGAVSGFCTGNGAATGATSGTFQCDSRYVATAKVTF